MLVGGRKLAMKDYSQDEKPTRIVIVDPHVLGHHSAYIRRIVEGAIARGMDCLVITSDTKDGNSELSGLSRINGARVDWVVEKLQLSGLEQRSVISLVFRQFAFWRYFRRVTTLRLDPARDRVLVPYVDDCSYAIALLGSPFGSTRWDCISMRAMFHFDDAGVKGAHGTLTPSLQRYLFERLASDPHLGRLFFIDETVLSSNTASAELRRKGRYLPDPAEQPSQMPMHEARRVLGMNQQDTIILMYGAISQRKGFAQLLNVFATPNLPPNFKALVVGQFDNQCRELFSRWLEDDIERRHRIVFKDRYVSKVEESQCLSACDMVWLAYENHLTMSGVLVQAGLYQKPVLGTVAGLIGWYIAHRKVGVALPTNSVDDSVATILSVMARQEEREQYGFCGRDTFKNNTIENFQSALFGEAEILFPRANRLHNT